MKINEQRLTEQLVRELTKYQNCLKLFISRVHFINSYILSKWIYYLQLFPISDKTHALINKFTGYLISREHTLRAARTNIYLPMSEGELNLKDIKLQGKKVRLHRFQDNLSRDV